ncbi:MAG TPA: NAD(P)/FAD-dependent oxidoreductase [Prolixibacteraceae bacterium]|nr:NAD(P)/FAD-dependent oxidoreductase [Prolixibacteraceae bacterium]
MNYDTIIVGGGIAGLTAAACLAKEGREVALFERQDKVGGQVQTFEREGVFFDTGLRSIENSGTVFPLLKHLGIDIPFSKSVVSLGVGEKIMFVEGKESISGYEQFLIDLFPENAADVRLIVKQIRTIMGYMDVLYGIDNPTLMNPAQDPKYLFKTLLPWMFRFVYALRKLKKLKIPADEYLEKITQNRSLNDIISQHFFQKTPTSFALSYFSLYLDYHYPKGGTGVLPDKLAQYIVEKGGEIHSSVTLQSLNPEKKLLIDEKGNRLTYKHLIWAADLKQLYNCIPLQELSQGKLRQTIEKQKAYLSDLRGSDSIFSLYLTIDLDKAWFSKICSGHFFYTPSMEGLSRLDKKAMQEFLTCSGVSSDDRVMKEAVRNYLTAFCELNTFEIAIPALRDPDLAPAGKTGMMISLLFDYSLTKKLRETGWLDEMTEHLERTILDILDRSIFPGFKEKISSRFSSNPLTIERRTLSSDGSIIGWAYTNPGIPVVHEMLQIAQSVKTLLPDVYQAGQWVYSPSGVPISILTGKLAADRVIKKSAPKKHVNTPGF